MNCPELYALANGTVCFGDQECHWCGSPCKPMWIHDDPPKILFTPTISSVAKRPGNSYICTGCLHWRRKSITVRYLDGKFLDRKSPCDFSWFITESEALAINKTCPVNCVQLYEHLLHPPSTFSLLIQEKSPNLLQSALVNDLEEIRADTPLFFTLDNVQHFYTIYDLGQTLKNHELGGNEPGVQALIRIYGRPSHFLEEPEKKQRGGQFKKEEEDPTYTKRIISSKRPIRKSA